MKLLTSLLFVLIVSTSVANSLPQQQMVTGTVTDATTGNPLPGVNVLIEGTKTGTSTNLNGKFSHPKPDDGSVIVLSFIGYVTQKVTYSGQPVIDIKLSPNIQTLEEVVVTGYGTQKKSDLTGAISTVKAKEIEKSTPVNIEAALQGRVPGLVVTSNSGDPGSYGTTITIRGIGTVNNNNPIYVVDGMLVDVSDQTNRANNINFLNPSDIASIEVLKDASAQAIYGSRGANGVILITTKKGSEGTPKVTFSSTFGYESLIRINKLMNASEFKDWVVTSNYTDYMRSVSNPDPHVDPDTLANSKPVVARYNTGVNTDWMKEILRNDRFSQNYDLSFSGGTKDFHYGASAGFLDKKGLIQLSEYKRYSFRLNTDYQVSKYITLGENLGITSSHQTGSWYITNIMSSTINSDPTFPVLKPSGSVDPADPDYNFNKYAPMGNGPNPVATIQLENFPLSYFTMVGNLFAEATILKEIKLRSSWGFNMAMNDLTHFTPKYYISSTINNTVSQLSKTTTLSNGWVWENTLTWNKKMKNHLLTALLGLTSEYTKITAQSASKQGIPSNDLEMQTFDAATTEPMITGGINTFAMMSYFGRFNYSFRDRYLLTATVRRDGSSKFGPGYKWGTFPSFSLGWKISEEEFFKNFAGDFISNLKLRAGWGQIGNSSLPVYNAYASQLVSTSSSDDFRYNFGDNIYHGYWYSRVGRPDITWETTEQTNIGVDISILKNELSISADYYIKNTRNMLLQIPLVSYAGYYPQSIVPYSNAGAVQNKGFEVIINYQGKTGNFTYGASINGSTFKNVVTSLGLGNKPIIADWPSVSRTEVGSSIGRFYGYVTDGIFQTEAEVQNYKGPNGTVLQPNAHAGDFRFKNINNDETIDGSDETWIGTPWPKLTYGFNLNLGYKVFDLVVFFQGSYGNEIYDWGRELGNSLHAPPNEYYYNNAWRGPGTSNSDPIFTTVDQNGNYYNNSNFYVENGSYLRLKNLQIGFNLSKSACEKLKLTNCRIWAGGTNLLTITKYHGNDPEVGATTTPAQNPGAERDDYYPKPIEITMGLTISF